MKLHYQQLHSYEHYTQVHTLISGHQRCGNLSTSIPEHYYNRIFFFLRPYLLSTWHF